MWRILLVSVSVAIISQCFQASAEINRTILEQLRLDMTVEAASSLLGTPLKPGWNYFENGFFESSIYVSDRNHIVSVGTREWFPITASRENVFDESFERLKRIYGPAAHVSKLSADWALPRHRQLFLSVSGKKFTFGFGDEGSIDYSKMFRKDIHVNDNEVREKDNIGHLYFQLR